MSTASAYGDPPLVDCTYRYQVSNLRPGTWRIQASISTWEGACVTTLHSGANYVNFEAVPRWGPEDGCSTIPPEKDPTFNGMT